MSTKRTYEDQYTFGTKWNDDYRYENTEEWLTTNLNIPKWDKNIPVYLGLDKEPLEGPWIEKLRRFLDAPLGCIVWHMFCVETYNYPLQPDIFNMNKDGVVSSVNKSGNTIMQHPEIRRIVMDAKKENRSQVLLPPGIDASFARLFQYEHCYKKNRDGIFKLRNRVQRETWAECPVCLTEFTPSGFPEHGPRTMVDQEMIDDFHPVEHRVKGHGKIYSAVRDNRT